jgi:hypothetical protein
MLLAGVFWAATVFAAEKPNRSDLDGREIVLRIYKGGQQDISAYSKMKLKISRRQVICDIGEPDYAAQVVVFGRDQKDAAIRELLGSSIRGWEYRKGLALCAGRKAQSAEKKYRWGFYDALGEPVAAARVEWYLKGRGGRILLGSYVTDSEGQVVLPFCTGGLESTSDVKRCRFEVRVSAVGYGTSIVEPRASAEAGDLFVPQVRRGGEADERCLWGVVLDPNGNGVGGAVVRVSSIIPPGGKRVPCALDQRHAVMTDEEGRFRIYPPIGEDIMQIGTLIPPRTKCFVRVDPPAESDLASFGGDIPNGQESTISLDYVGHFHTFVFEGEDGPITDSKVLRGIMLKIETPPPGRAAYFGYREWKDGGRFPLGTYRAQADKFRFQAIKVTEDSPEELVFKLPPPRIYYGRVVSGVSGLPMANALVKAGRQSVHTGDDGSFELVVPSDDIVLRLVLSKEEHLEAWIIKSWTRKEEGNRYFVPDVKLFPAATVKIHPVAKVKTRYHTVKLRPQWHVYTGDSPGWAKDFVAACGEHPQDGVFRDFEVEAGKDNTFAVPAGLELRINLRVLGEIEWAPVTIGDRLRLRQGEVLDLGEVDIVKPFNIFVEVVNSGGSPVEGVAVVACGDHDPAISSTDENGYAFFDFVGYSKGEFIVEHRPKVEGEAAIFRQLTPYEVRGVEDANRVYTLQLSDEMVEHLLR